MDDFKRNSRLSHTFMRLGKLEHARKCYRKMTLVLHKECRYIDELKILMLIYFIDLNVDELIDMEIINAVKNVVGLIKLNKKERFDLYVDTVSLNTVPYCKVTLL